MIHPIYQILAASLALALAPSGVFAAPELAYYQPADAVQPVAYDYDAVVYGGTPTGVTAAIHAGRMGKKTVLLSNNRHVGGLTSGGLTATDIGRREAIGGLANEFYERIDRIKNFRPSEAESLFREMLAEENVDVRLGRWLESVEMRDGRLVSA
jgi:NADPH-dependent 2,4-dienoyl-CoA reductase/sulfur reductase-like enzyme